MLKMKKVSETYDLRVFTDSGDYFGDIEDSIVSGNKVFGWKIRATKNSFLSRVLGSAKGVIVPHQLTKAVGDILIISRNAIPTTNNAENDEQEE
jgi:sporulation protein YlmC with PRC-barrel domain